MSSHTAHQEVIGLMKSAGISDEQIMAFNARLRDKPDLGAWLQTAAHARVRFLAEQAEVAARPTPTMPRVA